MRKAKFRQAKQKWVFNPAIKRRIPIGTQTGFPDFICIKPNAKYMIKSLDPDINPEQIEELKRKLEQLYHDENIVWGGNIDITRQPSFQFIECKINGKLDKIEKEKIQWIKEHLKIPTIIASKSEKRGEIIYKEWN